MSAVEEMLNAPEVIATTPVAHGTTVADIQERFKVGTVNLSRVDVFICDTFNTNIVGSQFSHISLDTRVKT